MIASQVQQYPEPPAPIRTTHVGDERVILLDDQLALVASKSEPDVWYAVEHGHCTCAGFQLGSSHLSDREAFSGARRRPPEESEDIKEYDQRAL